MIVVDGVRYRDEDAKRLGLAVEVPVAPGAEKAPETEDADTKARRGAPNKARTAGSTGTK